jgi:hypothetical protein
VSNKDLINFSYLIGFYVSSFRILCEGIKGIIEKLSHNESKDR